MMKVCLLAAATVLLSSAQGQAQNPRDYLVECQAGEQFCEGAYRRFRDQFPKAYRRDYQSQRNVAFCLSRGCDDAVVRNPILGCAWRIVIVASGSPKIDQTDTSNLKIDCSKIDKLEMQAAMSQADVLLRRIYGRPLPR